MTAKVEEYLKIYRKIESQKDDIDQIIAYGRTQINEKGEYAIYKEMQVPEKVINAMVNSRKFEMFLDSETAQLPGPDSPRSQHPSPTHADDAIDDSSSDSCGENSSSDSESTEEERTPTDIFSDYIGNCCDVFGREYLRSLKRSADNLFEFGRWYARKDFEDEMDQKLNFIRAATLMNAAIERYQTTESKGDYDLAMESLKELHNSILQESVSVQKDKDFVDFCFNIKQKVERLREDENKRLLEAQKFRNQIEDKIETNLEMESNSIRMIKQIAESNTENYKTLMVEIIKKCCVIMGEPPCQFVIAGLGSLAREEITLSSDFEHVIILQDGTPVTKEIREYFRWFTVIFHVIIIGLRETIIPSVDIASLCDPYSSDADDNWFKDFYTPCGISFDGMMPHACKCPLGRQRPTKNYDNVVELIQTASVMASYLTKEQQLKHGYLLHDVLSTTCYVYGSWEIYFCFLNHCKAIQSQIQLEDVFCQYQSLLKDVLAKWKASHDEALQFINVKKALYRPLTVLLHFLASCFNLPSQSSFSIVDDLRFRGIIDKSSHHLLTYAVAIALEIRMRCYRTKHRQRNAISYRDLPKKVGERCSVVFRVVMQFFVTAVQDFAYRRFVMKTDYNTIMLPSVGGDIWKRETQRSSLHVNDDEEDSMQKILDFVESLVNDCVSGVVSSACCCFYLRMYFRSLCECMHRHVRRSQIGDSMYDVLGHSEVLDLYLWANEAINSFGLDPSVKLIYLTMKAYMLYRYGIRTYEKANEVLEEALSLHSLLSTNSGSSWDRFVDLEVQIRNAALLPKDAIRCFENALEKPNVSLHMQYVYDIGIARSMWWEGTEDEANDRLEKLAADLYHDSQVLSREHYIINLQLLRKTFGEFKNIMLAEEMLEMLHEIFDSNIAGDYPGDANLTAKLAILKHYRYNFLRNYNVGKYSNFTYKVLDYEQPLYVQMASIRNAYSLKLFSCVRYGDMIAQIQFSLGADPYDTSYLRVSPRDYRRIWTQTKVISLMVLFENVKQQDFELFGNLLQNTREVITRKKILQPFIYACLAEYRTHPKVDIAVALNQHVRFRECFDATYDKSIGQLKSIGIAKFLRLEFQESAKTFWKLVCYNNRRNENPNVFHLEQAQELFLTAVMTLMVSRKRQLPFPHLKKCREISLIQTLWLKEEADLDEYREYYTINYNTQLASFYSLRHHHSAQLFNMAVSFLVYDERACAALLWKLIQSNQLDKDLYRGSVLVLIEVLRRICETTLAFSYTHRMS